MENGNNGNPTPEKIVDLIRKCLALAESPNENEAAAAMAKAQELLDKYNLSLADVSVEEQKTPDLIEGETEYDERWEVTLYGGIARENFCRVIYSHYSHKVSILGRMPNVCATVEMAHWLIPQLERLALSARSSYTEYRLNYGEIQRGASSRQFRIDFLAGAIRRVIERLRELNVSRRSVIPEMLALTVNLQYEADIFFRNKYPHTSSTRLSVGNSGGYSAGRAAADGVSIVAPSRQVESGGRYLNSGK